VRIPSLSTDNEQLSDVEPFENVTCTSGGPFDPTVAVQFGNVATFA